MDALVQSGKFMVSPRWNTDDEWECKVLVDTIIFCFLANDKFEQRSKLFVFRCSYKFSGNWDVSENNSLSNAGP